MNYIQRFDVRGNKVHSLFCYGIWLLNILVFASANSTQASEIIGNIELDREYSYRLPTGELDGKVSGSIPLELLICNDGWTLNGKGKIKSVVAVVSGCLCLGVGQANVTLRGYLHKPCEIRVLWVEEGGQDLACDCPSSDGVERYKFPFPLHPQPPMPFEIENNSEFEAPRISIGSFYEIKSTYTLHLDVPAPGLNRMLLLASLLKDATVVTKPDITWDSIYHIRTKQQAYQYLEHFPEDLRDAFSILCYNPEPFSSLVSGIDQEKQFLLSHLAYLQNIGSTGMSVVNSYNFS
jgi:hypothetical protein